VLMTSWWRSSNLSFWCRSRRWSQWGGRVRHRPTRCCPASRPCARCSGFEGSRAPSRFLRTRTGPSPPWSGTSRRSCDTWRKFHLGLSNPGKGNHFSLLPAHKECFFFGFGCPDPSESTRLYGSGHLMPYWRGSNRSDHHDRKDIL